MEIRNSSAVKVYFPKDCCQEDDRDASKTALQNLQPEMAALFESHSSTERGSEKGSWIE